MFERFFERFTEKANKVMVLAWEEANRLGHNYVGTELILLGLIGEGTGVAAKVLKSRGVNLRDARIEVEKIIGRGSGFVAVDIPFTPRAKRVLELSLEEARQLGHNYIGTEHLLLGLIGEGTGVGARVLENLGVDLSKVRTQVIRMLGETAEVSAGSSRAQGRNQTLTFEVFGSNLTQMAIKVMMLAQEEARRLGHNFVGTEQILLGLIGEGTGVAAKVLKSMGVNLKDARIEVEKIIGRGSGFVAVEIPFTPRAKRVLELSLEEARQLGHNYIGTEHLLLGLIREGEGVAARVLENLGVDLSKVRTQVIRMLGETAEVSAGSGGAQGRNKTPTLDEFGSNLTQMAGEGKLDPVVGRQKEIEGFRKRAIKVMMLAQEEARRLGHNYVGTELILLGLIGEGTGVAAKVLKSMGVNLKDARIEVEKIIGRGSGFVAVEIPFSPRAKRVLELSLEEARQLGHDYIGTEHLLLGLIGEGEGVAAKVLENLGVDLFKVRT